MTNKIHLVYLHGFDNSSQSVKASVIRDYCKQYHANINVHCPDLNMEPKKVIEQISQIVITLKKESPVMIIGSSLGGFFANILSNKLDIPVFLLNPCLYPEETLINLFGDLNLNAPDNNVFYHTKGGWDVTYGDMRWTTMNKITSTIYPEKIAVLLTTGDEVLNYKIALHFYNTQKVKNIFIQQGGDHQISNFQEHLPTLIKWIESMIY